MRFAPPAGAETLPNGATTLLIGEGIETVLSARYRRAGNHRRRRALGRKPKRVQALPSGIARIVIARDNDPQGASAADRLARRCARAGVPATIIASEHGDFNDDLIALGAEALSARLAHLFHTPVPDEAPK